MARSIECKCEYNLTCEYCLRSKGPTVEDFNYQPSEEKRRRFREYEAEKDTDEQSN
jgi:hypothetical protein